MSKSQIVTGGIADDAVTADKTFGVARPNAKPLIINGDMAVAQRGTSASGKTSGGYYTCDRMYANIDSAGTHTITQESLSSGNAYNNGFRKAWRIDTTTADASLAAPDNFSFNYFLEGQDLQLFKKGTSNAEKFTLAFWIKSNKTGTGNVNLFDTDNTRLIGGTYTISSANTWEHKVVNFAADTTGAFDNDNNKSLVIEWWLDSGTNFSSGTTDTTWGAKDDTDRNASGTLNIADNTANDWAITGIQLEVGEYTSSTLPPFQHESYADNELRCARYFYRIANGSNYGTVSTAIGGGGYFTPGNASMIVNLKTNMRVKPSVYQTTGTDYYMIQTDGNNDGFNSFSVGDAGNKVVDIYNNSQVSGTSGRYGTFIINNNAALIGLDAEL